MPVQKPQECNSCDLVQLSTDEKPLTRGFSRPTGSGRLGVALIGESLGDEEYWKGRPFVEIASAGSKLEECLKLAGVSRDDFLLWNVCACQPLNPKNSLDGREDAIDHCKVHFDRIVLGLNANPGCGKRVLLTLGSIASRTFVANWQGISEWRGFVFEAKREAEFVAGHETDFIRPTEETDYGLCVPGFHPSFIKRGNPELTPLLAFDIQRAIDVATGKFKNYPGHPECMSFYINEFPSLDDAWAFYYECRDNPNLVIVFDIETPKSGTVTEEERADLEPEPIIQIQFAVNTKYAIVFPWKEPFLKVISAILALENVKSNHFLYGFDAPRIEALGMKIGGRWHDTMWMFKHWHPRLPRGLQNVASMAGFPFPWKQEFYDKPQWYGGCDVIAPHVILRWLPPLMKRLGVWQGYLDSIFNEYVILKGAADRGLPVNDKARLELKDILKSERAAIHKELQVLVPDEIKGIKPSRKQKNGATDYGYVKEPKKLLKVAQQQYEKWRLAESGREGVTFQDYLSGLTFRGKPNKDGKFEEFRLREGEFPCVDEEGRVRTVRRWYKEMLFKASSQQLIRYLEWKRGSLLNDT